MMSDLKTEYVPTDRVRLHPENPRRGDVAAIRESLEVNGQYKPIVVNRPTMEVLGGNHTLRAARELGFSEIAVTFVDVDEEQAHPARRQPHERPSPARTQGLVDLLLELDGLDGTGYGSDALGELLDELASIPSERTSHLLSRRAGDPAGRVSEGPTARGRAGEAYGRGRDRRLDGGRPWRRRSSSSQLGS